MYTKHFGLTEEPFSIAANPRFLYMSASHREALGHLLYGIGSDSGFVLLTGEVGTGKTTVCRCLLQQLPDDTEVAFILNPRVSAIEMLAGICDELNIAYIGSENSIKAMVDAINRHLLRRHADGKQTVVIIDEAQNLSFDVLEQLRLLTNLETDERKLLRIILIGQPELAAILASPELKQVEQRITARYYLNPLQASEIGEYISHRLAVAGYRKVVFPPGILPKLYRKTNGIPRLINVICDRAMLGAYVKAQSRVNGAILNKAAKEVLGSSAGSGWLLPGSIMASVLLVSVATAAVLFYDKPVSIKSFLMPKIAAVFSASNSTQKTGLEVAEPGNTEIKPEVSESLPETNSDWLSRVRTDNNTLFRAEQTMFRQWGFPFVDNNIDPCSGADKSGLECFSGLGNLGSIIDFNRPAVLTLVDSQGRQFFTTLLAVADNMVTLSFAHGIETITKKSLEAHWKGRYRLLWRLSPQGSSVIRPGSNKQDVAWLTTRLLSAGIESVEVKKSYNTSVIEAVKSFQRSRGLVADGIAGRQTLIHLSSVIDKSVPKLDQAEAS